MLFLLSLMLLDGPQYHIQETNLFQVMRKNEVHVAENGEFYMLHFDDSCVHYYAADGSLKKKIGRRGKGPGEFTFPVEFAVVGERIYIQDMLTSLISSYGMDGTYIEQTRLPGRNYRMARGMGGWLYWPGLQFGKNKETDELKWTKNDFEKGKPVAPIKELGWGDGTSVSNNDGEVLITYSPISVMPFLASSPDGARCYFVDGLSAEIQVFDGATGKKQYVVNVGDKRIPFDTEWAEEEFLEANEGTMKRYPGVKIKKNYPEFFPYVRDLYFDHQGRLIVDLWRGRPDDNHHLVGYDKEGKLFEVKSSFDALRRNFGVVDGMAYIMMFEDEEEAGIAKVPLAEVEAFVKRYPISDWSISRSISISN